MQSGTDHDLIFAHQGNARVATSAIMASMVAVLIGGSFMAIGSPSRRSSAGPHEAGNAEPVRVIGAAPGDNVPCEQQVWPHIAEHCLTRTQARTTPAAEPAGTKTDMTDKTAAAQDDAALSPLTAASVDHGPALKDDATSGQGVQEDTAVLREQDTTRSAEATVGAGQSEVIRPAERPRRHVYRSVRLPFHGHFGPFHF